MTRQCDEFDHFVVKERFTVAPALNAKGRVEIYAEPTAIRKYNVKYAP